MKKIIYKQLKAGFEQIMHQVNQVTNWIKKMKAAFIQFVSSSYFLILNQTRPFLCNSDEVWMMYKTLTKKYKKDSALGKNAMKIFEYCI